MASVLEGKRILAVDDEPDILSTLEEEVIQVSPTSLFDRAVSYQEAIEKIKSNTYDIVILDIMGVRGFDLLEFATKRNLNVVMLTANALSPEALKKSFDMGARAYLPKEKLAEIVPFLEDVFRFDFVRGWKRLLEVLKDFFDARFNPNWEEKVGLKWPSIDGELERGRQIRKK